MKLVNFLADSLLANCYMCQNESTIVNLISVHSLHYYYYYIN